MLGTGGSAVVCEAFDRELRRSRRDVGEVLGLLSEVLRGLDALRALGIVHHDVQPATSSLPQTAL